MQTGIWFRWMAMHGVPRAYMSARARFGDPLGRVLMGPGKWGEPYPYFEQIRQRGRLIQTKYVAVTVDHEISRIVMRDNRFGAATRTNLALPGPLLALIRRTDPGLPNPVEPPAMVQVDPPEHTHYRRLVAQSFTPRAVDGLAERISEVTNGLLNGLESKPEPDLIADYAELLPIVIIAELLGVPDDSYSHFLEYGDKGTPLLDVGIAWSVYRDALDGLRELDAFLREHFDRLRSTEPGDTPFHRLAASGDMTYRELAANASLLLGAGFETTVNLIGNGIALLREHPDQLQLLRDDPDLWPGAVEEILRFRSPVQMTARIALEDIEVDGLRLAKGESVAALLGGANRDPRIFDRPNRFDITRPNARDHLAFGTGVHACIGAALARIEGVTALRGLFERYPELVLTEAPEPRALVNLHGYRRLPTRLRPRAAAGV
ncbi:MAG: cytochrome P450 [Mycobacterium sp.]